VDILKARCEVLHIGEGVDYRTLSKTTKLQQLQTSAADSIENLDKMDTNVGGMFTGAQVRPYMRALVGKAENAIRVIFVHSVVWIVCRGLLRL